MSIRSRKLADAIAATKLLLPDEETPPNLGQRLAHSVERKSKGKTRTPLLQRVSGAKRAPYQRIAERILGESTGESSRTINVDTSSPSTDAGAGPWVGQRFNVLRKRTEEDEPGEVDPNWLGHDSTGRAVWEDVLDEQRNRLEYRIVVDASLDTKMTDSQPSLHYPVITPGDWPGLLPHNDERTFRNFHVCPQNERAAHAVNEILDHPGRKLNPLMIEGEGGSGKTHLLWSAGRAFSLQDPERVARLLSCGLLDDEFALPEGWSEQMDGTSVLLIDDVHLLHDKPDVMHAVGLVADWALNLGIQVVFTTDSEAGNGPANRLSEVIRGAVGVSIELPSRSSLMMMLRTRSAGRYLILDDSMLAAIVDRSGPGWAASRASLEEISLAVESGDVVNDAGDIVSILTGRSPTSRRIDSYPISTEVGIEGERIANEVLDTVFADPLSPAVELYTEIPEIGVDEYIPPDLMPESSGQAIEDLTQRYLGEELERMAKTSDHALMVHERDAHLVELTDELGSDDSLKVSRDLSHLDLSSTSAFERLESDLEHHINQLAELEGELLNIALKVEQADTEELIELVDQLRVVELDLADIDPESLPLPEFVEARRKPTRKHKKSIYKKSKPKKRKSKKRKPKRSRGKVSESDSEKKKVRRTAKRKGGKTGKRTPIKERLPTLSPKPVLMPVKSEDSELTPKRILVPEE